MSYIWNCDATVINNQAFYCMNEIMNFHAFMFQLSLNSSFAWEYQHCIRALYAPCYLFFYCIPITNRDWVSAVPVLSLLSLTCIFQLAIIFFLSVFSSRFMLSCASDYLSSLLSIVRFLVALWCWFSRWTFPFFLHVFVALSTPPCLLVLSVVPLLKKVFLLSLSFCLSWFTKPEVIFVVNHVLLFFRSSFMFYLGSSSWMAIP